jgi:hypothetical protein
MQIFSRWISNASKTYSTLIKFFHLKKQRPQYTCQVSSSAVKSQISSHILVKEFQYSLKYIKYLKLVAAGLPDLVSMNSTFLTPERAGQNEVHVRNRIREIVFESKISVAGSRATPPWICRQLIPHTRLQVKHLVIFNTFVSFSDSGKNVQNANYGCNSDNLSF